MSSSDDRKLRREEDDLGARELAEDALWGIHTLRAVENFPISQRPLRSELVHALGAVKLACARTNRRLGAWKDDPAKADAIEAACDEMRRGLLDDHVIVDALQGGAGTSTNMNVNEVLASRALVLLGEAPGRWNRVSPLEDLNRHQSTNDVYPTALRVAAIGSIRRLEDAVVRLQASFQEAERRFAGIVKIGRTQLQDALPLALGREMGAYADVLGRDRWRLSKCEERLRVVNLGGTAIGTALTAPRRFVFEATDTLRSITGIGLARAENLVDATQNQDALVEVSGLARTLATTLIKIAGDLRLMSSGPDAGFGELRLPALQAGSSLMPGKVNPVVPEAVTQAAFRALGHDHAIALACASGSLELNPFLPLVADSLLEELDLLRAACTTLAERCVDGLDADAERCRQHVEGSVAVATALVPLIGHEAARQLARRARDTGRTVRELALEEGIVEEAALDAALSPEALGRLGTPER